MCRDSVINMIPNMTWVVDKWQELSPTKLSILLVTSLGSCVIQQRGRFYLGPFGTRQSWLKSGELTLPRHPFPSNVVFASLTLANQLNISFGIASKPKEHGGGWPSSCMSFVGLEHATTTISIENKFSLGKWYLRALLRESRFGTSIIT